MDVWKEEKWKAKGKGKDICNLMQSSRKSKGDKKALLSEQCKEIKENNRMGKTRDLFKKTRYQGKYFMQRWAR